MAIQSMYQQTAGKPEGVQVIASVNGGPRSYERGMFKETGRSNRPGS
ncbi:hypothetical protein [Roseibium marinum]|nr:hypothetical protein [Roseibium marinum]